MTASPRKLEPERLATHLDRLYRAALGMCGSADEAEDLVQETCLRVLRKPRLLRTSDDLAYLVGVLRNVHYSRLRERARRPEVLGSEGDVAAAERAAVAGLDGPLEAHEALAAVAALQPEYRDAVVAVDLAGLSYREAARALGTREGTIMSRLHRGRERVAEALGD
jgi:RNA polymerase sigma-70 factor (ECF subfamily)